ncbi:hypothetical protein [Psychromonas ingrahamii]|uniref:hypothetical protein n=1 Tax=Psychromonas ingrahamii TaxID=357794 RepID=UPI0002F24826|nr:hypothetical protein [Psychromonas ingrahamii]
MLKKHLLIILYKEQLISVFAITLYHSNQTICVDTHQVFAKQKLEPEGEFAEQNRRKACTVKHLQASLRCINPQAN